MGKLWWQVKLTGCLVERPPVPFLLDTFRDGTQYKCQDHHWKVFAIMNKTTIEKPQNDPFSILQI